MTANHEHTPTDEEMQELFETGAMVTEFAHSRQEATIDWQLWLQERDARIAAAAEQRGAVKALREAAKDWRWSAWADAPRNPIAAANYTGDWIESRADRIADKEGDDE